MAANGSARTGETIYNLNNVYRVRISEGRDVWRADCTRSAVGE